MQSNQHSDLGVEMISRQERFLKWHIVLGFLLFLLVMPLALASYDSYMSEDVISLSQKIAVILTVILWGWLWLYASRSIFKTPRFTHKIWRVLLAPVILLLPVMIFGLVVLLATYLVGDVIVMATASHPNTLNTNVAKVFNTRGCGVKVSFYTPATQRESSICGDHFESKPKVGDSLLVDEMISPYGTKIVKVRLVKHGRLG